MVVVVVVPPSSAVSAHLAESVPSPPTVTQWYAYLPFLECGATRASFQSFPNLPGRTAVAPHWVG